MKLTSPSKEQLYTNAVGEFQQETGKTLKPKTTISGLLKSLVNHCKGLYDFINNRFLSLFLVDRLSGDELDKFANGILTRIQPKGSEGTIIVQGDLNTSIPINTIFTTQEGENYRNISNQIILSNQINITSISRTGTIATATTSSIHNLSIGLTISITGFSENNFNQTNVLITKTTETTFNYTVSDTGLNSDTNGILNFQGALCKIISESEGIITELIEGVNLTSQITQITKAIVNINGITGGVDREEDVDFKIRIKKRISNNTKNDTRVRIIPTIQDKFPVITDGVIIDNLGAQIGISSIVKDASIPETFRFVNTITPHRIKEIGTPFKSILGSLEPALIKQDGLTDSNFISEIKDDTTLVVPFFNDTAEDNTSPNMNLNLFEAGNRTIVLYKKNSQVKTLSINEIKEIEDYLKNEVLSFTGFNPVIISAVPQNVSFEFTSLEPNNTAMQNAISNNLVDLFNKQASIGGSILESEYNSVILNTVDNIGNKVKKFTLSTTGTIEVDNLFNILTLTKDNIVYI